MSALSSASTTDVSVRGMLAVARPVFAAAVWAWFHNNEGRVVFSKWFVTLRVGQLRFLVEEIAGPESEAATGG